MPLETCLGSRDALPSSPLRSRRSHATQRPVLPASKPRLATTAPFSRRRSATVIVAASLKGPKRLTSDAASPSLQELTVAVPPPSPPPSTAYQHAPPSWTAVAIVFGLSLSSLAALATAGILYLRPLFTAAQRAAEQTEKAAVEMETAAKEMEKTALMFQQDIPLTMKDMQRASEEWELVGKQFNFLVGTVSRPLRPVEKPVEAASLAAQAVSRAAQAVGAQAGTTTASMTQRVVDDTSNMANALWATVNQFRQQLGLSGINSKVAAAEAQRVATLGRKQQEARAWIERWRGRTVLQSSTTPSTSSNTSEVLVGRRQRGSLDEGEVPEGQRYAVEAVVAALERAQRAAEEAALSSSALEAALERAESAGALSSSDDDDDDWPVVFDDEGGHDAPTAATAATAAGLDRNGSTKRL